MDLWIRSQNKEKLVKVNDLNLYDSNILKNDFILAKEDEKDYSKIMIIANDNVNLGRYTKERALEVLDELQNKLLKSKYDKAREDYGKHSDCKDTLIEIGSSTYVYEMPLE